MSVFVVSGAPLLPCWGRTAAGLLGRPLPETACEGRVADCFPRLSLQSQHPSPLPELIRSRAVCNRLPTALVVVPCATSAAK